MRKRRHFLLFALSAPALLGGCGFALRGSGNTALLPFESIYLGFAGPNSMGTELKRNIASSGSTKVADDPKTAQVILDVLAQTRNKQILSYNSQGRVREFTLLSTFSFQVREPSGKVLLPPTNLTIRRILPFDETQVLAKEAEEASLYREMQSDMVQQVMRRLAAIKVA